MTVKKNDGGVTKMRNPFRIIAETVRRHERRLLLVWVLVVLVAAPFAIQAREITESSEAEFVGNVESVQVEDLLREKFPEIPKATMAIIIDAKDPNFSVFDPSIQQFLVELEDQLISDEKLTSLLNVTSYKSIERDVQDQYWQYMNATQESLRETFLNLTQGLIQNVTNLRALVLSLNQAVNLTRQGVLGLNQLQYMVPGMYELTWWNLSRAAFYIGNLTDGYALNGNLTETELTDLMKVTNVTISGSYYALTQSLLTYYYAATNFTSSQFGGQKLGFAFHNFLSPNQVDEIFHGMTYNFTEAILESQRSILGNDTVELAKLYLSIYNSTWSTVYPTIVTTPSFLSYVGAANLSDALSSTKLPIIRGSQLLVLGTLKSVNDTTFPTAVSLTNDTLRTIGQNETADLWNLAARLGIDADNQTKLRNLVLTYLDQKLSINLTSEGLPVDAVEFLTSEALPRLYDSSTSFNETLIKNMTLTLINVFLVNDSGLFNMSEMIGSGGDSLLGGTTSSNVSLNDLFDFQQYLSDVYELSINDSRTSEDVELLASETADSIVSNLQSRPEFDLPTITDGIPREAYSFFVSSDNSSTIVLTSHNEIERDPLIEEALEVRKIVNELVKKHGLEDKVTIYVTGSGALEYDLDVGFERDISRIDQVTVLLVFLLLIIVFGSLVTWAIPLVSIGSALLVALASLWAVNQFFGIQIPSMLISILTVIMFGAGVDYVVFTLARYQEERRRGRSRDKAVLLAVEHAGESVTSSGLTVMIGFGSLMVSSFALLRTMGMGPLIGVSLSLIAVLTVIPAALFTFGDKLFWPRKLGPEVAEDSAEEEVVIKPINGKKSFLRRTSEFTTKHPIVVIFVFLALSAPFVYNAVFNIRPDYDFINLMPSDMESVKGLKVMSDKFPQGRLIPLQITMEFSQGLQIGSYWDVTKLQLVEDFITGLERIMDEHQYPGNILSITRPNGKLIPFQNPELVDEVNRTLMKRWISKDVDNTTVLIEVQFEKDPLSVEALDVVDAFKAYRDKLQEENASFSPTEVEILIGGFPSTYSSLRSIMDNDTPLVIGVVLLGTFIVLFLILGSVLGPIRLQFTIGLSVLVTLGLTEFVFVEILDKSIPWIAPVMITVILFGLGLDYDIFIVTRMREEVEKGHDDKEAIIIAIENTGRVITAAGIIMASALGSLMLAQNLMLQVLGFSFFVAILLDATLVRLFLVPAIMSLFEKWNWWAPGPFQRVRK